MPTYITVEQVDDDLPARNRAQQRLNRLRQLEREEDNRAVAKVEAIREAAEAAQRLAAQFGSAVPEYSIREETSAQRGGRDFGMGWFYESWADPREHPWATKNQYRLAFGSGDGSQWAYVDVEQDFPGDFSSYRLTDYGFSEVTDDPPNTLPTTRTIREYAPNRTKGLFVLPIGGSTNAGAIIAGAVAIRSQFDVYSQSISGSGLILSQTIISRTTQVSRVNFAFYVNQTRCEAISVPAELDNYLNQYLPNDIPLSFGGSVYPPAYGFEISEMRRWPFIYGTPGIWDIINNGFNRDYFDDQEPLVSEVTDRITITAPDEVSITLADNIYGNSIFGINYLITSTGGDPTSILEPPGSFVVGVGYVPDNIPPFESNAGLYGTNARYKNTLRPSICEYIYLTPQQRAASEFYRLAIIKSFLDRVPANPEFWVRTKDDNPLPFGVRENNGPAIIDIPTWLPEGDYTTGKRFSLSPNRILPPAIFNDADTTHPLIAPQPVPYRHYRTSSVYLLPNNTYSEYRLETILWADWKAGRQTNRLNTLGLGNVR